MYLFFDTETTGLPLNWKAPITDLNNWPRMVQIAWISYKDDGTRIDSGDFILKPEGFTIPQDASDIHGITTERAMKEGHDLKIILTKFSKLIDIAEMVVAHNMSFDEKIIGAEFIRKGVENRLFQKTRICTMKKSTSYCNIPGPYGPKWPQLSELHNKLFGTDFEKAHDAAADVDATAKCFWKLKELGIIGRSY